MIRFSMLALCLASIGFLSACTGNSGGSSAAPTPAEKTKTSVTVDPGTIVSDRTLSGVQKSDRLVQAAETLMTPTGFMFADAILDQALLQNAKNLKAQFYKALLAQPMATRGMLFRVKPLVEQEKDQTRRDYKRLVSSLPEGGLKIFLLDEKKESLKSEKEIQNFVDELYQAADRLREFAKQNKELELTLNVTTWENSNPEALVTCNVVETTPGVYEAEKCPFAVVRKIEVERADLEIVQQAVAGMQIYTALLNSYDASGALKLRELPKNPKADVVWAMLSKNANFGTLRNSGAALKTIETLGMDGVAGVRWAMKIQNDLCPNGRPANRAGYLIDHGVCIQDSKEPGQGVEDTLRMVESAISGQMIELVLTGEKNHKTFLTPSAVLSTPIRDLKELRPAFSACGELAWVGDASVGGLFPMGDANLVLADAATCGKR